MAAGCRARAFHRQDKPLAVEGLLEPINDAKGANLVDVARGVMRRHDDDRRGGGERGAQPADEGQRFIVSNSRIEHQQRVVATLELIERLLRRPDNVGADVRLRERLDERRGQPFAGRAHQHASC